MADYYIRSQQDNDSRGPFDLPKLQTLAEANQISENTLYYDEDKEEWLPIALNEELKAAVFPQREKLKLNMAQTAESRESAKQTERESERIAVEDLLDAAEGNTEQMRALKKKEQSFQRAMAVASSGIGLAILLSAITLLMPHFGIIGTAIEEETYATVLNYPFLLVGLFDLMMAVFLFLAVTEVYPLLRARGMLTLGFGLYVGWSLGDPALMIASAAAGVGLFGSTLAQGLSTMVPALVLAIGGNGFLAYLAMNDRFKDFFDAVSFNLIGQ
ncbi:MAG: GYF domain-containing protein [Verrucomicrobiota bacterium]